MNAAVEFIFCDHSRMLPVVGSGVVEIGRVYDDDAPLAMVRHFGHGGGRSIAFVNVITYLVVSSTC